MLILGTHFFHDFFFGGGWEKLKIEPLIYSTNVCGGYVDSSRGLAFQTYLQWYFLIVIPGLS